MPSPLKILVVGCGGMSNTWLDACSKIGGDIRITGLIDLDTERACAVAEKYELNGIHIGSDLETALKKLQPDAVFNITIPDAHHAVTMAAFEHGCHVLTEKPLAATVSQAKEMVGAAAETGRIFSVIQNRRYASNIRRLKAFLDAGCIGQLHGIHADFFLGPHFGGFREQMDHVLLLDMAIHTFDQARYLTGLDANAVFCHETNPPQSWYHHGADAHALFEMQQEATFTYRGSWCAEGLPTSWQGSWRFIGDKGTVLWDGESELRAECVSGEDGFMRSCEAIEAPSFNWDDRMSGHEGVIRDFLKAVHTETPPLTNAADNLRSLAMVEAAIQSAESGKRVVVNS